MDKANVASFRCHSSPPPPWTHRTLGSLIPTTPVSVTRSLLPLVQECGGNNRTLYAAVCPLTFPPNTSKKPTPRPKHHHLGPAHPVGGGGHASLMTTRCHPPHLRCPQEQQLPTTPMITSQDTTRASRTNRPSQP